MPAWSYLSFASFPPHLIFNAGNFLDITVIYPTFFSSPCRRNAIHHFIVGCTNTIASEDEIILATRGGLAFYNINSGEYQVFTKDNGLSDTDLNTVLKGPKGYLWLGSDGGVQIWDINQEKLADWFELDIEEVTKFVTYNNMVYGAIKQAGIWGIMEFIHSNDRLYYRDFYGRNDIEKIDNIVKFGDRLILSTDRGLLAGNPHDIHPLYWSNPFPEIQTSIIALDQRDDELRLLRPMQFTRLN